MANLEFDREAVGVSAKADWHDSQTFASVELCAFPFVQGNGC